MHPLLLRVFWFIIGGNVALGVAYAVAGGNTPDALKSLLIALMLAMVDVYDSWKR